jgi:alkanesulfonate monooxygenase SsuD/methylene tetrahydromethanopterin reductase-like flavin-dependent oxidoreductase (luciferase family)
LKPATAAPPEIFTAARTEAGLEMIAGTTDWWFVDYPKDVADVQEVEAALTRKMADMRERAARHNRRVRFAFNPFIAFGDSEADAVARTQKLLTPDEPDADVRKMVDRIGPAMKSGCIGRPEDVRRRLQDFHEIGIDLFLFKFPPVVEEVRAIAQHVIRPLRGH